MNRKYLEEIIPKREIFGYYDETDNRYKRWDEQVEKYGFCEIETWDLDRAFAQIIYERLMMYLECADGKVDLSRRTIEVLDTELTLKDAIEFTIWECKKAIKATTSAIKTTDSERYIYIEAMDIVWQMMSKMHKHLWW